MTYDLAYSSCRNTHFDFPVGVGDFANGSGGVLSTPGSGDGITWFPSWPFSFRWALGRGRGQRRVREARGGSPPGACDWGIARFRPRHIDEGGGHWVSFLVNRPCGGWAPQKSS